MPKVVFSLATNQRRGFQALLAVDESISYINYRIAVAGKRYSNTSVRGMLSWLGYLRKIRTQKEVRRLKNRINEYRELKAIIQDKDYNKAISLVNKILKKPVDARDFSKRRIRTKILPSDFCTSTMETLTKEEILLLKVMEMLFP